MSTADTGENS
eukprot:gene27306-biopygen17814